MKIIICILLSALFAVSLVCGLGQLPFKNAILLDEGVSTPFAIDLNDSSQVTGDINVSLVTGEFNWIGYSSKTSINVNDVIFYQADESSLGYQDAKTNGWISGLNESVGTSVGIEATTLELYRAYWIDSTSAVKMTFPNVGGSNTSTATNISWSNLILDNGTNRLGIIEAGDEGWIDRFISYWDATEGIFGSIYVPQGGPPPEPLSDKIHLNTWEGMVILSNKPNIYLLFENKTIPPQNIIVRYDDKTAIIPQNHIERFDDGTIEISVPKNIFMRFFRWIARLA